MLEREGDHGAEGRHGERGARRDRDEAPGAQSLT
jgi:hypothetical protein